MSPQGNIPCEVNKMDLFIPGYNLSPHGNIPYEVNKIDLFTPGFLYPMRSFTFLSLEN